MKQRVWYDGIEISNYCSAMCLVRQGLAGDCWNPCKSLRACCDKECGCSSKGPCENCPCIDDMWFHDPANPCSQEFQGIIVNDIKVAPQYQRSYKETLKGGSIGKLQLLPVEITMEFFIVASSEEGTDYGVQVLSQLGARRDCFEDCVLPELRIQNSCEPCYNEPPEDIELNIIPDGYEVVGQECHRLAPAIGHETITVRVDQFPQGVDALRECFPTEMECGCPCVDPAEFEAALTAYENGDTNATFSYQQAVYEVVDSETQTGSTAISVFLANFEATYGIAPPVPEGYEVVSYSCDYFKTEELCGSLADVCVCPTCESTSIFRNVLPTGPVIERESSLRRCCGTLAEWTFVAEIPYRFFQECAWTRLPNMTERYPNWCRTECTEDVVCENGPTGEQQGIGVLGAKPSVATCYCEPLFVHATAIEVGGSDLASTFVNWRLTATDTVQNLSVCWYPDLGSNPLDDPEAYACIDPLVSTVALLRAGETLEADSTRYQATIDGELAGPHVSFRPIIQDCRFGWLVVKSDVENADVRYGITVEAQKVRGTL